ALAAASTVSGVVVGDVTSPMGAHLRVGEVVGPVTPHEGLEAGGHEHGVVGLGVVGGAADVGGEHHVGHAGQGVVDGQGLTLEVIEGGGRQVAVGQGGGEGVEV